MRRGAERVLRTSARYDPFQEDGAKRLGTTIKGALHQKSIFFFRHVTSWAGKVTVARSGVLGALRVMMFLDPYTDIISHGAPA
jgi:hypothetical protein